jgi:hypothetical protein
MICIYKISSEGSINGLIVSVMGTEVEVCLLNGAKVLSSSTSSAFSLSVVKMSAPELKGRYYMTVLDLSPS